MIAPTASRVENSSDATVNERIRDQNERMALKVLRGDFVYLGAPGTGPTVTSSLLSAIEE